MSARDRRVIVVAFGNALLRAYFVEATPLERAHLAGMLQELRVAGAVAWSTLQPPPAWGSAERIREAVAGVVGRLAVDAAAASPRLLPEASPAWLMPIWPFDHERGGFPAATGDLQGATLELAASPCADEEGGVTLPGYCGRWYLAARTLGDPSL